MNKYYILLNDILRGQRLSITKLAQVCDLPGLPTIYRQLRRDSARKLRPDTVGRIEHALDITIIDKGNELTYKENKETDRNKIAEYESKIKAELQALEQYTVAVETMIRELAKAIGGITIMSERLNKVTGDIARRYQDMQVTRE